MKSMQSLIPMEKLRTTPRSTLAEVSLSSTSSYQLIVEHDMRTTLGHRGGSWDQERQGTWGRFDHLLQAQLDAILIAQWTWKAVRGQACFHVLMERPRKRTLPCLPRRVVALQQCLNALPQAA
jgi:hypothetical protein